MFALLSLLFFQGMGSEVYEERVEASANARQWGIVFALLAPDNHPNPEVNTRIRRAKIGYPHDSISFEYWLRKNDTTLRAWHWWIVRNHGSQIFSNLAIQCEIADVGLSHQFQQQFNLPYTGALIRPFSVNDIVWFDTFIQAGKK